MLRKAVAYALTVALTVATVSYAVLAQPRSRVDTVRARGKLVCGVSGTTPGFSFPDPVSGRMVGFDADFCWAVASFLDVPDVEFVNLTSASRIPAVVSGSLDVVFRTTTQTISRDDQVDFGPVTFYDGQRLMVRADSRISGLDDLNGARICVFTGTTSERNITDQMRLRNFRFQQITFAEAKQAFDGLAAGRCDVFTTDASQLTAFRATAPNPADFKIVGREFSDEPLAPMFQENDSKWADVVAYTVWGMILAEELGITRAVGRMPARWPSSRKSSWSSSWPSPWRGPWPRYGEALSARTSTWIGACCASRRDSISARCSGRWTLIPCASSGTSPPTATPRRSSPA